MPSRSMRRSQQSDSDTQLGDPSSQYAGLDEGGLAQGRGNAFAQTQLAGQGAPRAFDQEVAQAKPGRLPFLAEMEAAFGADFSSVDVVFGDGGQGALPADAATDGDTVFFRSPNPDREQVAHELMHVCQQANGGGGAGASAPGDASEREADTQAQQVAAGGQAEVNHAGGAAVYGDWMDDVRTWATTTGHDVAEGLGLESSFDANLGRAEAFKDHGDYGPQDVVPGTGKGGFEATYHPASDSMQVTLRCAVNFVDGLQVDTSGAINPAHANLQADANAAAGLSEPDRSAFIAQYQWAAGDKGTWMADLESSVEGAWSQQHEFFINRPQWEWIGARINVDIVTNERARAADDHLALDSIKVPVGTSLGAASVSPGSTTSATDQTGTVGSTDIQPRVDNMLAIDGAHSVTFANGSAALDSTQTSVLDTWIATYQGAPGNAASNPTQITLEAHASASGSTAFNEQLAQQRAQAVSDYLSNNGFTNVATRVSVDNQGETGADPADDAFDRRVDLIVDGGDRQVVANHEFGHAFGLGDEYAIGAGSLISGTGATAGTPAAHDSQVQSMTDASGANLPGAIHENNGNIMSLGNAVRPQHYSTFHEALCTVTGVSEWALGAKQPKPTAPGTMGPGDFPTPDPNGPMLA
ncbi:MAG: OmpA family protein [Alphaproteobacteria bacterium]|nr:OmpA family protein [Alphaproteobacteria bacterium]